MSFRGSLGLTMAGTHRQVLGARGAGSSLSHQPVCVLNENRANAGKLNEHPHTGQILMTVFQDIY